VPGEVQGQDLAARVEPGQVDEYRPPDPAVERQAVQQHERRSLVCGSVQVGRHACNGDLRRDTGARCGVACSHLSASSVGVNQEAFHPGEQFVPSG
jgi:hypothetical protein